MAPKVKRRPLREALAAGLMITGACAVVWTIYPWLNPQQYRYSSVGDDSILIRTLIGGGISVVLLWLAFHFNKAAESSAP